MRKDSESFLTDRPWTQMHDKMIGTVEMIRASCFLTSDTLTHVQLVTLTVSVMYIVPQLILRVYIIRQCIRACSDRSEARKRKREGIVSKPLNIKNITNI